MVKNFKVYLVLVKSLMKLLWKKLLLGKFLLLKIVKYWNNKLAIWSHWSLHCYKQHLDQSAGNFESRKVFYGCAVVDVVVIKFCASKSISNSGMQFYFILHLFLSEFSFTLFICVCVPPCDCLVALYLLLRLVHPSADSAVDSCVSAER